HIVICFCCMCFLLHPSPLSFFTRQLKERPAGTTFIETVNLPNAGGTMDVCQLERRYDGSDF
ncbi:MAG: hypothetical protein RQ936_08915, partial [Gammaproteobacteria bacterium]|nr:hypothetical protein [Gammaproteobacteria bacterium]